MNLANTNTIANKCLVAIKKVINPYVPIKVKSDFSGVITEKVRTCINPFDEIALEEARKLKEQGILQEIIVVSIGDDCQELLLQALASGNADRAILIKTDRYITPLNVAKILRHLVIDHQANMVFLGKQAIDDDCNQTGQMLAGLLDWPQASFVSKVTVNQDSNLVTKLIVEREVDNGIEKLQITIPVVITVVDADNYEPRYIPLPDLMQAKKKTIDLILLQDLAVNINNLNLDNIQILKTCLTPKRASGIKLASVDELVDKLKQEFQVF